MTEVTSVNFKEEVLDSPAAVLVDFWAEWCGPCRLMSPIVEEVGKEVDPSKLKVVKVNVDQAQDLAQEYGIMSIPSFKIFKGGQVVDEFVGSRSKESVLELLKEYIA